MKVGLEERRLDIELANGWNPHGSFVSLKGMNKVQFFLIGDGAIVVGGLALFAWLYFRNKNESHFKDDIWKKQAAEKRENQRIAYEDQVDKKILLEHKPDPKDPEEKPVAQESIPFKAPNFRGKPHEILGIPSDASPELVGKAYKFWIKRYHPDRVTHLGAKYVEQARLRAEQLNSARQIMLKK